MTAATFYFFKKHLFKYKSVLVGMDQYMCRGVPEASSIFNIMTNALK